LTHTVKLLGLTALLFFGFHLLYPIHLQYGLGVCPTATFAPSFDWLKLCRESFEYEVTHESSSFLAISRRRDSMVLGFGDKGFICSGHAVEQLADF